MTALPCIIGILNITPDSFSDGGAYATPEAALKQAETLVENGAGGIDIGAESTRPGATLLSAEEEWARLAPVLAPIRKAFPDIILSIDTRHANTAKRAADAGADWINDVAGARDSALLSAIAPLQVNYVLMHSISVPPQKDAVLQGADPIPEIIAWAEARLALLQACGIGRKRVVFDPGLGFGKNVPQSFCLMRGISRLNTLALPLFIGHSRKSFMKREGELHPQERDFETHLLSFFLTAQGVQYLRVHDVAGAKRAIAFAKRLKGAECE